MPTIPATNKLPVIARQNSEFCIPQQYLAQPTPYEFLQAYHEADCVVTNSFHGTVFATIMHRPFLSLLQRGRTKGANSQLLNLLKALALEQRLYQKGDMRAKMEKPIDWAAVEQRLDTLREQSITVLRQAIAGCRENN